MVNRLLAERPGSRSTFQGIEFLFSIASTLALGLLSQGCRRLFPEVKSGRDVKLRIRAALLPQPWYNRRFGGYIFRPSDQSINCGFRLRVSWCGKPLGSVNWKTLVSTRTDQSYRLSPKASESQQGNRSFVKRREVKKRNVCSALRLL